MKPPGFCSARRLLWESLSLLKRHTLSQCHRARLCVHEEERLFWLTRPEVSVGEPVEEQVTITKNDRECKATHLLAPRNQRRTQSSQGSHTGLKNAASIT